MPFPYPNLVSLLEALSNEATKTPPPKPDSLRAKYTSLITQWFNHFRPSFTSEKLEPIALFSLFFPELRPDRVYNLREDGLVKVIARCLGLGVTRQEQLSGWRRDADGDLGTMVCRVMRAAENPVCSQGQEVTVEDIEKALEELSSRSIFSSQRHIEAAGPSRGAADILGPLFRKMTSTEGKWFTRAILKSYLPVIIPEKVTMDAYHFLLPSLWAVQSDLRRCLEVLEGPVFKIFPPKPEKADQRGLLEAAAKLVRPQVGVRVGRVEFVKARSCKNASALAHGQRMSMERKYDGEYCQVHIDLSKTGDDWIKIFSKSGRDSTHDRMGIHSAIREALRINKPREMSFKKKCILEGELVVYCEKEKQILEFWHLRSHVRRSGIYLGTSADERPDFDNQHLMLVLFDVLLIDDLPYLTYSYDRRIKALYDLIYTRPGYIEFATVCEIDFRSPRALEFLRERFAHGIVQKWEGFVLKPCDGPYLDFVGGRRFEWIKLKKDYIPGLGDTADFAIVGGGYEAGRGRERGVKGGGLTTFFVGALRNKEAAVRFGGRPSYKVVFHVSYSIAKPDLEHLNRLAYFRAKEYKKNTTPEEYDMEIAPNLPPIDVYFTKPMVFEVMGGGFDKPSDCNYYILRWPRVVKIHWDRDWKDAVGFNELQELAELAVRTQKWTTTMQEDKEERRWERRLEEKDVGGKRKQRDEEGSDSGALGGKGKSIKRISSQSTTQSEDEEQDSEMETPPRSYEETLPSQSWNRSATEQTSSSTQLHNPLPSPPSAARRPPLHPIPLPTAINAPLPAVPPPVPAHPSPLLNAMVFVIDRVLAQPKLEALLALHKPKAVYGWTHLPSMFATSQSGGFVPPGDELPGFTTSPSSGESSPSTDGPDKFVLLIETRTPRTSKRIITECIGKGVSGFDCYDWRVVGHSDWKGEARLDLLTSGAENVAEGGDGGKGEGEGEGRRRKVDWDLFHMLRVR